GCAHCCAAQSKAGAAEWIVPLPATCSVSDRSATVVEPGPPGGAADLPQARSSTVPNAPLQIRCMRPPRSPTRERYVPSGFRAAGGQAAVLVAARGAAKVAQRAGDG